MELAVWLLIGAATGATAMTWWEGWRERHPKAQPEPDQPIWDKETLDQLRSHEPCTHCGGIHVRACPRVRRMVFDARSNLLEVEFWPPGKWPDDEVIWPEDLPESPDDEETDGAQ